MLRRWLGASVRERPVEMSGFNSRPWLPAFVAAACVFILCASPAARAAADTPAAVAAAPTPAEARDPKLAEWERLLYSRDPQQRASAAGLLLASKDRRALGVLTRVLEAKEHPPTRISILKALEVNRDDRAIVQVLGCVAADEPGVRGAARATLVRLNSKVAIERMVGTLSDAGVPRVTRIAVADAMAAMREFSAVPALIQLLSDPDAQVRQAAEASLVKITVQPLGANAEAWQRWWDINKSKSREWLLEEIIAQQDKEIHRLRGELVSRWIHYLRNASNGNTASYVEALHSGLPDVQIFAANALARLKPEGVVAEFLREVDHSHPGVRRAVVTALGQMGSEAAIDALLKKLDDADPQVRVGAANALGVLKAASAVQPLIKVLAGIKDEKLCVAAAKALGEVGDAAAVEPLMTAVSNAARSKELREEAAIALGKLKDKRARAVLVRALKDVADRVRWAAADSLGRLGLPEAVPALGEAVTGDTNAQVREAAAVALGRIGRDDGVPALLRALRDPEKRVADQALAAALRIGGDRVDFIATWGNSLLQNGQFDSAIRFANEALKELGHREAVKQGQLNPLREIVANAHFQCEHWPDARRSYLLLIQATPANGANLDTYFTQAAVSTEKLKDYPGLLEIYKTARKRVPTKAEIWWAGTERVLKGLVDGEKCDVALKAITDIEKNEPGMGGEARKTRILILKKACAREEGKGPATGVDLAALIASFARDEETRKAVVGVILGIGGPAVPALIDHGLKGDDPLVQNTAIDTLERITKHPFGITKGMTAERRATAIKVWLSWWEKEGKQAAAVKKEEPKPAPKP